MNWNLVGSIYGRSSITIAHFVPIHWQTWPPQAILVSGWLISKNLFFWNCLAKWTETWWEASMEGSVLSFLKAEWMVSDTGSVGKNNCQFNFLTKLSPFVKLYIPLIILLMFSSAAFTVLNLKSVCANERNHRLICCYITLYDFIFPICFC